VKFGLPEKALTMMKKIFQQYPEITAVKIFGSRAKGNYSPSSDVDLVIAGEINELLLARIRAELDELPLPYLFDTTTDTYISHPGVKEHIHRFGKDIYIQTP
jgi:predicted nucleotidyltransferase